MKTLCNTILFLLLPALLLANTGDNGNHKKEKRITKAYLVNSDAGIDIQNSYGSIYVTTWDEDKIELDILIKVSGTDEEWVEKRIASIDIEINALKNLVSAETVIGNSIKSTRGGSSMEINYTIKIPKKGSVKLSNKYGNIIASDLIGSANISCKYGKVTLAKLGSNNNVIDLAYVDAASIEKIATGSIDARYSKVNVADFGKLAFTSRYTDLNAQSGDALNYESNYGKINLARIGNIRGNGNYLTVVVAELAGNFDIETRYSTVKIGNIAPSGGNINVNGNYTTVEAGFNPGYAFDFDITGSYSNIKLDGDLQVNTRHDSDKTKIFKGFYRKSGANKVAINSDYGNITLSKN